MNRFRTKKKDRVDLPISRPSIESENSGPFRMFGRNKRSQEDDKQQIDLTSALPSSDDFRTSLLMTGLSARFSMLREQDDPLSKIGKASDDSVLLPKRQSRLNMELGSGLHDIAEVESIRAPYGHAESIMSSYDNASYSGNIMDRAKPSDGNNLFGGRQKIYKIPAGGAGRSGGLSGRALYDDDVAQSAFRKWKVADKERLSSGDDTATSALDLDAVSDFSRRRETNSTTSSVPSAARNSSAATSIHSQANSKDVPSAPTTSSGIASSATERNVSRTRRLYEQGLNQDLHDHQTSAMSRMDTISRQRPLASRMADLAPKAGSPVLGFHNDRSQERRPLASKASAPNLRSFSPYLSNSAVSSPAEPSSRFPSLEPKPSYTGTPPLSPPISESEEHPSMTIGPNDRGKATAMGVFSRPTEKYDDSKYTQRQRQLQRGRETPSRTRADSTSTDPSNRSGSSSPLDRESFERSQDGLSKTDTNSTHPTSVGTSRTNPVLQVTLEKPNDQQHPAFRQSALPTPLSISSHELSDHCRTADTVPPVEENARDDATPDSPTLGPPEGLSGMVRQHLRNVSTASSVYPDAQDEYDPTVRTIDDVVDHAESPVISGHNREWAFHDDAEWRKAYGADPITSRPTAVNHQAEDSINGQEEFARHLAEGARRVREKLTSSYASSDNEPSGILGLPHSETAKESTTRQNPFGILRSKTSRTSLADRGRETQEGLHKFTSLRVSSSSRGTSPAGIRKPLSEDVANTVQEPPSSADSGTGAATTAKEKEPGLAGIKAFRQARRELQRLKQSETQQRHGAPGSPPEAPTSQPPPPPPPHRAPPTPLSGRTRGSNTSEAESYAGARAQADRMRSDSETSSGGHSRPTSSRNGHTISGSPTLDRYKTRPYERPSPLMDSRRSPMLGPPNPTERTLFATASTPNLHGSAGAPPLPPINPRRKTPQGRGGPVRGSEDEATMPRLQLPNSPSKVEGLSEPAYADDSRGRRLRASPPRGMTRPPLESALSSNSMPGGIPSGMF